MWSDVEEMETVRLPAMPGVVAVIGLGRVGLSLAAQCAARGWRVLGCDASPRTVECVNSGRVPFDDEADLEGELPALVERGLLTATLHTSEAVARASVVLVTLPLQIDEHQPRFHGLDAATELIGYALQPGTLVCYETALPVGTTAGRLRAILERCTGFDAPRSFYLAACPARVAPGRTLRDLRTYPKIVGGCDVRSTQLAATFYRAILPVEIISMPSSAEAELARLVEIAARDVHLALANEFARYADEHGLDLRAVLAAANTRSPVQLAPPGVGVGGTALPVFPYFLLNEGQVRETAEEESASSSLRLVRQARLINDGMAEYAVQRIEAAAGSLWHRSVLLLGVTAQADLREIAFSSAYLLQTALWQRGATVYADDPLYGPAELHALGFQPLPPDRENEIDAIILQTAHRVYQHFDFQRFTRCRLLLDGRHALSRTQIEEAGLRYIAPGDGREDAARCVV